MLLRLGEAELVGLLVSSQVLSEIEAVIRRKAIHTLPLLAVLIDASRITVVPPPPAELFTLCQELIPHPGDARILADAWSSAADYLVTLDKAHFLSLPGLSRRLPFPLGTPGDCLAWYRAKLQEG